MCQPSTRRREEFLRSPAAIIKCSAMLPKYGALLCVLSTHEGSNSSLSPPPPGGGAGYRVHLCLLSTQWNRKNRVQGRSTSTAPGGLYLLKLLFVFDHKSEKVKGVEVVHTLIPAQTVDERHAGRGRYHYLLAVMSGAGSSLEWRTWTTAMQRMGRWGSLTTMQVSVLVDQQVRGKSPHKKSRADPADVRGKKLSLWSVASSLNLKHFFYERPQDATVFFSYSVFWSWSKGSHYFWNQLSPKNHLDGLHDAVGLVTLAFMNFLC